MPYSAIPMSAVRRCASGEDGGSLLSSGSNYLDGLFQFAAFKESQAEVQTQAGHGGIERQSLAIEGDGLLVVFLAGFKKAKMGAGFGVVGVRGEDGAPRGLGFGDFALLLQREGGVAVIGGPRRIGLRRLTP